MTQSAGVRSNTPYVCVFLCVCVFVCDWVRLVVVGYNVFVLGKNRWLPCGQKYDKYDTKKTDEVGMWVCVVFYFEKKIVFFFSFGDALTIT
jgi:hypothetical protein